VNENQHAYFLERYRGMSTEELVDIKVGNLIEVARDALNTVISERGVNAEEVAKKLRADDAKYDSEIAAKQQAEEDRKDRRDARYFKILMIAGIPMTILGFVFAPGKSYVALISALVQGGVWALIAGILYALRRKRKKKA
jgi:hypothetical protein